MSTLSAVAAGRNGDDVCGCGRRSAMAGKCRVRTPAPESCLGLKPAACGRSLVGSAEAPARRSARRPTPHPAACPIRRPAPAALRPSPASRLPAASGLPGDARTDARCAASLRAAVGAVVHAADIRCRCFSSADTRRKSSGRKTVRQLLGHRQLPLPTESRSPCATRNSSLVRRLGVGRTLAAHVREQQHVPDGRRVRQQHHETVDAEPLPSGGR